MGKHKLTLKMTTYIYLFCFRLNREGVKMSACFIFTVCVAWGKYTFTSCPRDATGSLRTTFKGSGILFLILPNENFSINFYSENNFKTLHSALLSSCHLILNKKGNPPMGSQIAIKMLVPIPARTILGHSSRECMFVRSTYSQHLPCGPTDFNEDISKCTFLQL